LLKKLEPSFCFLIIALVIGCAAKTVKDDVTVHKADVNKSFFESSDTALIREALVLLSSKKEEAPDYNTARAKLEALVQKYPKSKWVSSAQGLNSTIDKMLLLQSRIKAEKTALDKANADKTALFTENESLRGDNLKLKQENEKLKSDMALLKKLEIQLEKREKMLK
jgi:hypothetical protein